MPGTVDVWVATTAGPAPDRDLWSRDELARASRFASPAAGARWLAARDVLRRVLGAVLGEDPASIVLAEGPGGKPVLHRRRGPHFNLSHSGELVAVALGDRPVGVDIEVDRRLVRPERLAARLYDDPDEIRRWALTTEPLRSQLLLQRWTEVEAVLKATGDGISAGMAGALPRLTAAGWSVRGLDLGPAVRGAVAAAGHDWTISGPRPVDVSPAVPSWAWRDSNPRPPARHAGALPPELHARERPT
jgi:4'-phosphopantetheinyl transferase